MDANDLALFADRGFTSHEYLSWFNLYNMNGRLYDPLVARFISPDPYVQVLGSTQSMNRYTYCMNNPLRYTDPSGYTWGIFKPFVQAAKWTAKNWVYVADTIVTTAAITAEVATGQLWLIVPTINAGLNVYNNADNIKKHPGNFGTFWAIGAGTGYLTEIGAGPLGAGFQTGLNDLVRGETKNILNDMLYSSAAATLSLGLSSGLNQTLGMNKTLSNILGNMAGTYLSSSYNYRDNSFDWSLNFNKIVNIAGSGAMAGLNANSKYQVPKNMSIPGNYLTEFFMPSFAPFNIMPTIPQINLPSYYPGMNPSPLPLPLVLPIPNK